MLPLKLNNILTSSKVFDKSETSPSPVTNEKTKHYFFSEGLFDFETAFQQAENAILKEIEIKGKNPTFKISDLRKLFLSGYTHLVVTKRAISLSNHYPKFDIKKAGIKFLDGFTLFYSEMPFICSKGYTYEYNLYCVYITKTDDCPCGLHKIPSENKTDSSALKLFTENRNKYLSRHDSQVLTEKRYEVENNILKMKDLEKDKEIKKLKDDNKKIKDDNKILKESDEIKGKNIESLESKIKTQNEKIQVQDKKIEAQDEKIEILKEGKIISKYTTRNTDFALPELGIGTFELIGEGTAELIAYEGGSELLLTIAGETLVVVPILGAVASGTMCLYRLKRFHETQDKTQLWKAAGDAVACGLAAGGLGIVKLIVKGIVNLIPVLIDLTIMTADYFTKSFKVKSIKDASEVLFLKPNDIENEDKINEFYEKMIFKLNNDTEYQNILKKNKVDVENYKAGLTNARNILIKNARRNSIMVPFKQPSNTPLDTTIKKTLGDRFGKKVGNVYKELPTLELT